MVRFVSVAALLAVCGLACGQDEAPAMAPTPTDPVDPTARPLPRAPPQGTCSAGFSVRKATEGTTSTRGPSIRLRFQNLLTNRGGWSHFRSEFTAPCSGYYYFSFHAVADDGRDFTLALMKNGRYQVTAYGGRGSYQQASNSAFLYLNRFDRIHLELQQGNLYEHPFNEAYTTFSGFLVGRF